MLFSAFRLVFSFLGTKRTDLVASLLQMVAVVGLLVAGERWASSILASQEGSVVKEASPF